MRRGYMCKRNVRSFEAAVEADGRGWSALVSDLGRKVIRSLEGHTVEMVDVVVVGVGPIWFGD